MQHRSFFKVLILSLAMGIAVCAQPRESRAAGSLTVHAGYDLFASGPGTTGFTLPFAGTALSCAT